MLARTPDSEKIAVVFDVAADMIRDHGLLKFNLGTPEMGFCIRGALFRATKKTTFCFSLKELEPELGFKYGSGPSDLVDWNNAPERTGEEVIQLLRNSAKRLREFGQATKGVE